MRRNTASVIAPPPNPPPVDRCFCCGKPVWDGDFVRREIRVGSSTGSAVNLSSASWGGSAQVLGSGSTIIGVNHTAIETVCNECALRQDAKRKSQARTRAVISVICLGAVAGLVSYFGFLSSPGPSQSKGVNTPAPAQADEFNALVGASWSSPIIVQGTRCLQVVRFNHDGTYERALYLLDRGDPFSSESYTFEITSDGVFRSFRNGKLIEEGKITLLAKDQWNYEITSNTIAPQTAGIRLTFTRQGER
jgi:hypothetical protein